MKTRAITGIVFVLVMVSAIIFNKYVYSVFFTLLASVCLYEFYSIVKSSSRKPQQLLGIAGAVVLFVSGLGYSLGFFAYQFMFLLIPVSSLIFITALFQKRAFPFEDIAFTFIGLIYVVVPFFFYAKLAFLNGNFQWQLPMGFMILLWTNDTGAYLAGRSFGRYKLFERISPKKTWEGFAGGVLLAVFVAINLGKYFGTIPQWQWICMALIIGIFGTMGDLVESMLKRSLDVKDSGHILPGHGGFLDRFDGLLVAAPLVYVFLLLVN